MKLHVLVIGKKNSNNDEQNDIKMINEIIQDHTFALNLVKSLERVVSPIMLCQFVLFSYSFCFLMFNFTMVNTVLIDYCWSILKNAIFSPDYW